MTIGLEWSRAFARQARADLNCWNRLSRLPPPTIPASQRLHFLQMACEKLAKAHLCRRKGCDPYALQSSHAYIEKTLPTIIEFAILTAKPNISAGLVRNRVKQAKHLFREIELLHPQVDDGGRRPDNCEYPWVDGSQTVHVPAEHDFEALNLVDKPGGLEMLKAVEQAINDLCP